MTPTDSEPDHPPLPIGAAAPDRLRGSAFGTGAGPPVVTWTDVPVPVTVGPQGWGAHVSESAPSD